LEETFTTQIMITII